MKHTPIELMRLFQFIYSRGTSRNLKPEDLAAYLRWVNAEAK